jgi:hypothetical protein
MFGMIMEWIGSIDFVMTARCFEHVLDKASELPNRASLEHVILPFDKTFDVGQAISISGGNEPMSSTRPRFCI